MNDMARFDLSAVEAFTRDNVTPEQLEAHWMPFTANRQFKAQPRMLARAEGMYYYTPEGRQILDGTAGLWCVNAGHCRKPIVDAISRAASTLDYAPPFQIGHPMSFQLANKLLEVAPKDFSHVFFVNSGSEAVDTALKMAIAYHRLRGDGTRVRLIGRERGYHGVGFGGISVGGMVNNRKHFGPLLTGVDHLPHTHNLEKNAYTRGQPQWGAHLADDLERIIALHDASTIAAVIIEPMAGSTGVLMPPVGYLERIREITHKHGILLIFDEVISGFGRLGAPFAVNKFNVMPDLMTVAKGINSGTVPMGAVFTRKGIYETFMQGPQSAVELFHGYTYSAHPLACAAGLATQQLYQDEGLFERAAELESTWADALHDLKGVRNVIDIRTMGLVAGIELESRQGAPGARAFDAHVRAFFDENLLIRVTGDIIALSPPLIIEKDQIGQIAERIRRVLERIE